jgi:flavin reductase (DIM6/NTAB) family NADH-FMN oxidoreductase RutF
VGVDPLEFRSTIGRFATGVTVVTTASGNRLHGMTANAIASLSLDPVMLLVCVEKTTHMHGLLLDSGVYAVNILTDHQEDVSRIFAKKGEPEEGTLRGVRFRRGATGSPVIEGCLAFAECRVAEVLEGGDHSIFLGEVVEQGVVDEERGPLLFYRGGYHSIRP